MGFGLGTQELANEFWRLQKEGDPAFLEAIKDLNFSLLFVCLDCPGNLDRQLAIIFEDGKFAEITTTEKPAPSDLRTAPFDHTHYYCRVQAPVQTLVDLCHGKIDLLEATKVLHVEGDFGKFMVQIQGFIRFMEFLGTMDIEP
jgi:hypothetical protein